MISKVHPERGLCHPKRRKSNHLLSTMGLFTNTFTGTLYRFTKEVVGTSVDDNEVPRFLEDTHFEPGTEFRIVRGRHAWAHHPQQNSYYTIWVKGSEYNVLAQDVEGARELLSQAGTMASRQ